MLGLVFVLVVLAIARYTMRLGKPVNEALSDSYYHHRWKEKIIYSPMGNWFELGYTEMDADPKTFVVLHREFGKDHQSVYWRSKKQTADVSSFYLDENRIPKDKQHVYHLSLSWPDTMTVVPGANPATYQPYQLKEEQYNTGWYRDDHAYYLDGRPVSVDYATFQRLNRVLAIDTNQVYIIRSKEGQPKQLVAVQKNPGGNAMRINDLYVQVGAHVFVSMWDVELIDLDFKAIQSLSVLDDLNIVVNGELVSRGKRLPSVDVASLEILQRDYLRDRQHAYFMGEIIAGADPTTFEVVYEAYSKDREHVFYQTRLLPEVNPATFKMNFAEGTATDGVHTYRDGELIK